MKTKIVSLFAGLGLLASSCTDLSDEIYSEIPADTYPENEAQAQLVTIAAYSQLQSHIDGGWWFAQELTADLLVAPTR